MGDRPLPLLDGHRGVEEALGYGDGSLWAPAIHEDPQGVVVVHAAPREVVRRRHDDPRDGGGDPAGVGTHDGVDHATEPEPRRRVDPRTRDLRLPAKGHGRAERALREAGDAHLVLPYGAAHDTVWVVDRVVPSPEQVQVVVVAPCHHRGVRRGLRKPVVPHTGRQATETHRPQVEARRLHPAVVVVAPQAVQRHDPRRALRVDPGPCGRRQPPRADVDGGLALGTRPGREVHQGVAGFLGQGLPIEREVYVDAWLQACL
mmetsp:Transcript_16934/g.43166  ORF Transcript_16934/g.43166 Transcript_16934/m.43166 type:complete len:260 (+) Transcript_16934:269-1048(+)